MSAVRKFRPKLALTAMMKTTGTISAGEALKRADEALGELEETCLGAVDEALEGLEACAKAASPDIDAMYKLSSDVVSVSGAVSAEGLDVAAHSLCDYLDRVHEGERLDARVIGVHIASMRLLHRSSAPSEARQEILKGLEMVVARHREAKS